MTRAPALATSIAIAALLAACSNQPAANQTAQSTSTVEDVPVAEGNAVTQATMANDMTATPDYAGRWTGVEGMYLVVARTPTPGRYTLEMQYDLDHKATAEGHATDDGIAFDRDGRTLTLRPTDGAATGLKHLAAKKDCLTVASGEGYCRD